jgi:hypothetical protein
VMKKLIVGLLAVGAVLALRPVVKRRVVQRMREHCKQMMSEFAGGSEATGCEAAGRGAMHQMMREHCGPMAAQQEDASEAVAVA